MTDAYQLSDAERRTVGRLFHHVIKSSAAARWLAARLLPRED